MTTTLPYRGRIYCSLGEVISGQFADTYLQEAGLVFCRGSVELAGIYRPDIGTVVDFAYARGNTAARIPRRLRVLSSFADPFTRITSVQLGCKLSLLQEKKPPRQPIASSGVVRPSGGIKPADVNPSYAAYATSYVGFVAGAVPAAATVQEILNQLDIAAAGPIPLAHNYMTDEFSLEQGYVAVLGSLLQSESYVGYLNESEELVIRSLAADSATAGPVLNSDNIFTLSPIGVGGLPAETVFVEYTDLQLRPSGISETNNLGEQNTAASRAGWAKSTTTGFLVSYSIPFTFGGTSQAYNGSYTPVSTTSTTFDDQGRAVLSVTSSAKPYAAAAGGYASEVLGAGGEVSLENVFSANVTASSYDELGRPTQVVVTDSVSLAEFAGSLQLRWAFGPGDFVSISSLGSVATQRLVTTYQYSGNLVRRSVDRYQNWALTQSGQQAIAAGSQSFTSSTAVTDFFLQVVEAGLQFTGSEVNISSSSANGQDQAQQLPSLTDLTIRADSPDRRRREQTIELNYSYGSAAADTAVTFRPPYSPDSHYTFSGGVAIPVPDIARARASAITYGRIQNKLRLGNRQGLSLQVPCELMPVSPFDCMYLVADGLVAQYRANGMNWTFSNQGIVGQVDALFWLAIGNTGTPGDFWFPGPPGVTSLPSAPTITTNASPAAANAAPLPIGWDFQAPDLTELFTDLPVATPPVFPSVIDTPAGLEPYAETVNVDAVGRAVFEVESFPYSLAPQTTDVDMVGRAVFDVREVALTAAPAATFTLAAFAPQVYAPAYVPVPSQAVTLTSFAPTITGAAVLNMPVVALTLTARRPDVRAAAIVAVPSVAFTLTSYAPVFGEVDPEFANVSLLLPLDSANGLNDLSNNAFTMTAFGSAGITTSDSDFPDGALELDGSTQYLQSPANSAFAFGTGAFTVECYLKADVVSGNDGLFTTGDDDSGVSVAIASSSATWSLIGAGGGDGGAISAGVRQHLALTRDSSNNVRLFVGGTQLGATATNTTNLTDNVLSLGYYFTNAFKFDGRVSWFRVTKGVARYTSAFTPPSTPFPSN